MPKNEEGKFKGFAFVQFTNVFDAGKVRVGLPSLPYSSAGSFSSQSTVVLAASLRALLVRGRLCDWWFT